MSNETNPDVEFGLALSGGGFRATLFHLGVVAFLRDHGLLPDVRYIASVSGGSILAAHLVQNWEAYLDEEGFREQARKIVDFAELDVRGRCLRRLPGYLPLTLLSRRTIRRFFSGLERPSSPRNLLLARYLRRLYGDSSLGAIADAQPSAPALDILATNLTQGCLAYFSRGSFVPNHDKGRAVPTLVPISTAVAISASFPLFFPPRRVHASDLGVAQQDLPNPQDLTDAGVFDNLGISRLSALLEGGQATFHEAIVSDATGAFDWEPNTNFASLFKTAVRSSDILMKRIGDLQVVSVRDRPIYRFLRISDPLESDRSSDQQDEAGSESPLADRFVRRQLKKIRTDLDAFSNLTIRALFHHGYTVAFEQLGDLVEAPRDAPAWLPGEATRVETKGPRAVAAALENSQRRKMRFFSARDWISYVHLALIAGSVFLLWTLASSLSERTQLLRAFSEAPKDTFGILEHCTDIEELHRDFEPAQLKWQDNVAVQTAAAVVAASRNEPTNRRQCGFEEAEPGLVRAALQRLSELDERGKKFSDDDRFHFHRLRGYVALRDANQASADKLWDTARAHFDTANEEFERAWLHRGKGLYRLEYYLCSTEVERIEMLKHRLDEGVDTEARDRFLRAISKRSRTATMHCDRALEFSREELAKAFWPAHFLKGKLFLIEGQVRASEDERLELLRRAADEIIQAHQSPKEPGDEPYFRSLESYIPGARDLCRFEDFEEELDFVCEE